jgi:hypothetical protein
MNWYNCCSLNWTVLWSPTCGLGGRRHTGEEHRPPLLLLRRTGEEIRPPAGPLLRHAPSSPLRRPPLQVSFFPHLHSPLSPSPRRFCIPYFFSSSAAGRQRQWLLISVTVVLVVPLWFVLWLAGLWHIETRKGRRMGIAADLQCKHVEYFQFGFIL